MHKNLTTDLLEKYFKGECSQDEAYKVAKWISSERGNLELTNAFDDFDSMDEVDRSLSAEMHAQVMKRIRIEAIARKIEQESASVQLVPSQDEPESIIKRLHLGKVAATLALIISAALSVYVWGDLQPPDEQINTQVSTIITKRTEAGQKLTVHLSDGSVAVLNANSSISYPENFSDSLRQIEMSGEVYFDIAKNPEKPFVVNTSQLATTALGTSFNIRAFGAQSHQVSLVTGKVRINALTSEAEEFLEPGQEITFDGLKLIKTTFDPKTKVLWKDGIIYFNSTPLEKCFEILENWYDVEISVTGDDRTTGRLISGRFDNDYLVNVLNSLSYAQNFEYTVDQKRITIEYKK